MSDTASRSPQRQTMLLVLSWLVVVLPTAWGLEHTVQSALKLFQAPSAANTSAGPH